MTNFSGHGPCMEGRSEEEGPHLPTPDHRNNRREGLSETNL